MTFEPKYTITNRLLSQITKINALVTELNHQHFPEVVLFELEKAARAVSAHASTSIEGNPLPLTEVKKILKNNPAHIRDSEKEVLNYNSALQDLGQRQKNKPLALTSDLILDIQRQITDGLLPKHESGKYRQNPVVLNDPKTGEIVFLPPDVNDVQPLMGSLLNFVRDNNNEIDPLILAGIFHKQMVIIHPFMDGNGRTARLATKILLAEMELNTFNLFSFENYYNKNVTKYFQKVGEFGNYYDLVNQINFTQWLEYFTEGIIDELLRVQGILAGTNKATSPQDTVQPHHQLILDHIAKHGFITDKDYSQIVDRAKATRVLDFQKLIELGMIMRKGSGRATHYVLIDTQ